MQLETQKVWRGDQGLAGCTVFCTQDRAMWDNFMPFQAQQMSLTSTAVELPDKYLIPICFTSEWGETVHVYSVSDIYRFRN